MTCLLTPARALIYAPYAQACAAALSQALAPEQRSDFGLEQLLCPPESSERTLALMRGQLVAVLAEGV